MNIDLTNVLILGAGKTGISVQNWCFKHSVTCTLWENEQESLSVDLSQTTCVVMSPGMQPSHPLAQKAKEQNIPVVTDIDLFFSQNEQLSNSAFGVTGTNGKSTTVALLHHILKEDGKENSRSVFLGGNIGIPVLELPVRSDAQYVVELSSYQLELSHQLNLNAAVLLNITPDHLDRHGTMIQYSLEKMKIFDGCQNSVVCVDDFYTQKICDRLKETRDIITISCKQKADYYVDDKGGLFIQDQFITSLQDMPLKGVHNWQNILAAFTLAHIAELSPEKIVHSIKTFSGLVHRLQIVRTINKITFINDSKGTNAEATEKAIKVYHDKEIYIILGGRAKVDGIQSLVNVLSFIEKAYLIGETSEAFAKVLSCKNVKYEISHTIEKAVRSAFADAQNSEKESVVLLSPSCASFDQFKNFEERGDVFCDIVRAL